MTRRSFLKFAAAAVVPWSGCGLSPEPPLRVGASIWPGYECLFIARSLRLYKNRPVKLVEYPSTLDVVRSFRNGAIEVAAMTGDDFLRLAADEPDVRAILVLDISKGADAVIGRPGVKSLKELSGKKVGLEVNTLGAYMLSRALDTFGMVPGEIEVVPIESDQHVVAFEEGRVEAVVTMEPHRTVLLKKGGGVLFDSAEIPGEVVDCLVTRQSVVKGRGETIRALVHGWFSARERLLSDGENAARLVAGREGASPEEFLNSLNLLELPSAEKNRDMLKAEGALLRTLRKNQRFLARKGISISISPEKDLVNGGFLP